MLVYKVVSMYNNEYYSACTREEFPREYIVKYKINKVTTPKISGALLFAFTKKAEAFDFASKDFTRRVFEAETPSVIRNVNPQKIDWTISKCLNDFNNFWTSFNKAKSLKKKIDKFGKNPMDFSYESSVCCPSIKLLKEIEDV